MSVKQIEENFRFMLLEVRKQLEATLEALEEPSEAAIEAVESRDDYIDNLKSVIENNCFAAIHGTGDKRRVDQLRALHTAAINLERLADHGVNVVRQLRHYKDPAFLGRYDFKSCFNEIFGALGRVYDAFFHQRIGQAFKICLSELTLDALYKQQFERILHELQSGRDTGELLTTLFIFRYLERIGDALLNIGEAAIFAILGEKFKIHQYEALRSAVAASGREIPITDVEFESIWGTRSGCRIGKLTRGGEGEPSSGVIFKEGNRKKLLQERDNIALWEKISPGLPPKVISMREDETSASLLIEFLGGCTMQDVVLMAEEETLENVLFILEQTLHDLWESTMQPGPVAGGYIRQLRSRLPDVYRLYPDFRGETKHVGRVRVATPAELYEAAEAIDASLSAPFSVFIHGDFNINNIVYDHETQRLHYIDLHRSKQTDFVQDVSVFLVSNFRLPVFYSTSRPRLEQVMRRFYHFSREFAQAHGDVSFDARLTLGLARSFITSTRFELNRRFAKAMFQRGIYLLERLTAHSGPHEDFRLPLQVFSYF